jgi:hypothetical protein
LHFLINSFSTIEAGQTKPGGDTFVGLAKAFVCSAWYFFGPESCLILT